MVGMTQSLFHSCQAAELPHVESRRPNVSIAFHNHGLDDALFHCQRELRHAQRQLSDQNRVAITLKVQTERLKEELREGGERPRSRGGQAASVGSGPPHTQLDDARRRAEELEGGVEGGGSDVRGSPRSRPQSGRPDEARL